MKQTHDEFTHLTGKVSRQRILQLRWIRDGKCQMCGKVREKYAALCDYHHNKQADRQRKRLGCKRRNKNTKFTAPANTLGGTIRFIRTERKITTMQMAEVISYCPGIEHGTRDLHLSTLTKIAEKFGMKAWELLLRHEQRMEGLK